MRFSAVLKDIKILKAEPRWQILCQPNYHVMNYKKTYYFVKQGTGNLLKK